MLLSDFEQKVDPIIVVRGKDYVDKGRITTVKEVKKNHYVIKVTGSASYKVDVVVKDDLIINSSCNCPYDQGDICKHQTAAFYGIRDKRAGILTSVSEVQLESLISEFSNKELISIIVDLANDYPEIEKKLMYKFASNDDEISSSKKLMKDYINRHKHSGFIYWNEVSHALEGVQIVLEKARGKVINNPEHAVLLSITALAVVVDMLQYCDDSGGDPGMAINECFSIMKDAMVSGALDDSTKNNLFTKLLKEAALKRYEGWSDWQAELLEMGIYVSDAPARRKKIEKRLETMLKAVKGDKWDTKYETTRIKLLQWQLIDRFDGEIPSFEFILNHTELSAFREKAIVYYLNKKEYNEVLKLCLEGQLIDQEYSGLVTKWKQYQIEAYEGLGEIDKQRELTLELMYGNDYEYFIKLKSLYDPDEWPSVRDGIVTVFEKQKNLPTIYTRILIEEKLKDKLLAFCKREPYYIEQFYPYLKNEFPNEVDDLYRQFIESEAVKASDRKKYRKVCKIIKTYNKVCGADRAKVLIEHLKHVHINRPAFIDELTKLK